MKNQNLIEQYKKPIVMAAFLLSLVRLFTNSDFPLLGTYTQIIISGVCAGGLLVFVIFYNDSQPEQVVKVRPLPTPDIRKFKNGDVSLDVSQVIEQAHKITEQKEEKDDTFTGFDN